MRFVGIDIGSERHFVAVVSEEGEVVSKATGFEETAEGYEKLIALLGEPTEVLVAMEATGHYWQNLFARLAGLGFRIALLNPVRTARFAEEEMRRTKTDAGLKQSGKRNGQRAGIAHMGHATLRAKLWMPVLAAVRKNPWLKAFYDRLIARGKLPKVALTAALRKLLLAVYSVAKNRRPFVPRLPSSAEVPT